jgi:hypothetical protein
MNGHTTMLTHALILAAPPSDINTEGILSFLAGKVAPILIGVLAIVFLGRAAKGSLSSVLTSSAIAIIALAFLAGATTLFFLGDTIVKLMFK